MNLSVIIKRILNPYFLSFIVFLISAIYITFPLVLHIDNSATSYGDQFLHGYIFSWVSHNIFTNPFNLFTGTFYYPYLNPIAYSDVFITSAIIAMPILKIFNSPITAVNFTLISSIFMVGFFTFILSFYLTKNFLASLVSGLILVFSPAFLDKEVHIQTLSMQWIPLSILFFIVFTKNLKSRYLFLALLFFDIQFYNSFLPGYFLLFFDAIYLLILFIKKRNIFKKIFTKLNLFLILLTLISIIPLVKPYYDVYKEYDGARNIRDTIHFALQPEDLIYPNQQTRLQNILVSISNLKTYTRYDEVKYGYIGFIFSILSIILVIHFFRKFKGKDLIFNSIILTGLTGFILSFGPALHFNRQTIHIPFPIILPYALFYYLIPGFKGFRNSERWEMLFLFCFAVGLAFFLPKILAKRKLNKQILIYGIIILGIVAEYNFPMKIYPVKKVSEFPKVYHWLNSTPKDSVYIQMPIYNWNTPNSGIELEREYYSTVEFRKTVNGYSGFSPTKWQENARYLYFNFPASEAIKNIKNMKVKYIIVNKKEYNAANLTKDYVRGDGNWVISELMKRTDIYLLVKFDNDYVFAFKN